MKLIQSKIFNFPILILFSSFIILQSCAPVFSELQTAKTVGKDNVEVVPTYSSVSYRDKEETEGFQNQIGLQVAYGVTNNFDIRGRLEHIWLKDSKGEEGVTIFGVGPKLGILKDKISFYLPVGRALGSDYSETWQLHPTLLMTLPALKNKIDITLAPKYLMLLCEDCPNYGAVNLGFSFSNDLTKWAIRPEYGILFHPETSSRFRQFSLGFVYFFREKNNTSKI